MIHKCIGIKNEVSDLNRAIDDIEKLVDTWHLRYYLGRLQERHDILITNRDIEIQNLKNRIIDIIETNKINTINLEKINIHLKYNKSLNRVTLYSDSKKYASIFDEVGRKWFIPELSDNSYIIVKFIGKKLDEQEQHDENRRTLVMGLSASSAIIGNTVMGNGRFKDIKNNFILEKYPLRAMLISQDVWFTALSGTEDMEIIETSEDIVATLENI